MITALGFVLLACGGALARAEIGHAANHSFPMGTLVVNVTGAFALGLLAGSSSATVTMAGTAGLGTFTTFSSFARDVVALIEERRFPAAVAYVAATIGLGLAAAGGGLALAGV